MSKYPQLLIVDDDEAVRYLWSAILKKEGYDVLEAATSEQAFEIIEREHLDLIIADLKIDSRTGIDILKKAKLVMSSTEVVVVTGYGSIATAVEAMHHGAFTYLTKPVDPGHLVLTIQKAYERRSLFLEVKHLKAQLSDQYGFENVIAESQSMRKVVELARRIAESDATILIRGESGTGKELIARCIHQLSNRRGKSFLAVNCSAIPETLLEGELFGHIKGSFTGAFVNKTGLFEEANGGTLVLDEIGDMPLTLQAKLLRVLQEGEIRRLGDNKSIHVDVRIMAITNKDIPSLVTEGKFREDLFFRLNVIQLRIPPLRNRKEDILPLAQHFLRTHENRVNKTDIRISPRAATALVNQRWLGNVRELENTIERATILCSNNTVDIQDLLPVYFADEVEMQPSFDNKTLEEIEKDAILYTLKKNANNQSETARRLGIGRNTLWRKMKLFGMPPTS